MINDFVSATVSTPWVSRVKRYLRGITDPIRFRLRVHFQPRKNHIYSHFWRFPNQYAVLVEHIIPRLLTARDPAKDGPLEIAVFACCCGEEAYTLAYVLAKHAPGLPVKIRGYDIVPDVIAQAKLGSYPSAHVRSSPFVTPDFVAGLFDAQGETCTIKPELASLVSFEIGDITDAAFMAQLTQCDLIFAQNVLFHLPRPIAKRAFGNIVGLLRPGATLFVNGMDSDMRAKLTKQHGLTPVTQRITEIYEDSRVDRGAGWANSYWGREPLKMSGDWMRKYCTIFSKNSSGKQGRV
jgi:chemotaxis protein methyltransferase CheR